LVTRPMAATNTALQSTVLAIPSKHGKQTVVSYLDDAEVQTLLATPDRATWSGRRDHLLLLLMVTTGMRVSEVTSLARADVSTNHRFACVSCTGKGRKQARHTARPPHGRGNESMARRKHRRAGPTAVHRTGHKPSPQPRRSRTANPTARRGSDRDLPDAGHQARHASRPAPHLRHADARPRSPSPPSHCSSATSRWHPPAPTSMPTLPSSSAPSTAPPRPRRRRAATSRPTTSSPSSKPCSYAELSGQTTTATCAFTRTSG